MEFYESKQKLLHQLWNDVNLKEDETGYSPGENGDKDFLELSDHN